MTPEILDATLGQRYDTVMTARTHTFSADEPAELGGADTAPSPVELLMGSLASCTAITMRMYAERKQWPLEGVDVQVQYTARPTPSFVKQITMRGDLDATQRARMLDIADRCPVARMLSGGVAMESRLIE
jgi:putative redox protein